MVTIVSNGAAWIGVFSSPDWPELARRQWVMHCRPFIRQPRLAMREMRRPTLPYPEPRAADVDEGDDRRRRGDTGSECRDLCRSA